MTQTDYSPQAHNDGLSYRVLEVYTISGDTANFAGRANAFMVDIDGDLEIRTHDNTELVLIGLKAGAIYPIDCKGVLAGSTSGPTKVTVLQ